MTIGARESLDKVFTTHFHSMATVPFEWKGVTYEPRAVRVSPHLARGLGCPPMCGACCHNVSLEYLPFEELPYNIADREVRFNGKVFKVFSDNDQPSGVDCKHLSQENGRCGIHGKQPFACDFEVIRFRRDEDVTQLLTGHFGRFWILKRIDGERGAKCEITPASWENVRDVVRRMQRLAAWMEYFEVPHKIAPVICYLTRGDWRHGAVLHLSATGETDVLFT